MEVGFLGFWGIWGQGFVVLFLIRFFFWVVFFFMKSGLFVAVFFFFLNFQAYFSSNFKKSEVEKVNDFH